MDQKGIFKCSIRDCRFYKEGNPLPKDNCKLEYYAKYCRTRKYIQGLRKEVMYWMNEAIKANNKLLSKETKYGVAFHSYILNGKLPKSKKLQQQFKEMEVKLNGK